MKILRLRCIILLVTGLGCSFSVSAQLPMPDRVCAGVVKSYWVDSTANPGSVYTWSINGLVVQSGTACAWVYKWDTAGNFELTLSEVSANGCTGELQTGLVIISPPVGIPVFFKGSYSTRSRSEATVIYGASAENSTGMTYCLDTASLAGGNAINPLTGEVTYSSAWYGTTVITARAGGCSGPVTAAHTVSVSRNPPSISWDHPADIVYGTPLSNAQLNAASDLPGSFEYMPVAGTLMDAGPKQVISVVFTPSDPVDYHSESLQVLINVAPRPVVVQSIAASKVYDGNTSASILSRTADGIVAGDQISLSGGLATFDSPSAGTGKTVTISGISLTGPDAGNYGPLLVKTSTADILPLRTPAHLSFNTALFTNPNDRITMTAAIEGGASLAGGFPAASTVTFTYEGNDIKSPGHPAGMALSESGSGLSASLTVSLSSLSGSGLALAGTREVIATFTGESKNYSIDPNPVKGYFSFIPEPGSRVFPNPVSGPDFTVILTLPTGSAVIIDLYSSNGQLVTRIFEGYLSGGEPKIITCQNQLPQGIYLYRIRTENLIINGRMIIIRAY